MALPNLLKPKRKSSNHPEIKVVPPLPVKPESYTQRSAVHEVIPPACQACGGSLSGQDSHPHRHQMIDLPPVEPDVVEYRLHGLRCACCDTVTRALLPSEASALGYGERLTAMVALLSGAYRLSYRPVCAVMDDPFGARRARSGIGHLRQETMDAVKSGGG